MGDKVIEILMEKSTVDGGNGENSDDDDDHHREVETNGGESEGANCYLSPFDNKTIRYVVVVMV